MASLTFLLRHLGELALFGLSAYSYGRLATRSLPFRDRVEQSVLPCALGFGILASLLNLLGLAGALNRPAILALVFAPLAIRAAGRRAFGPVAGSPERPTQGSALVLLLPLLICLALSLYPPTAFDSTLYHLPMAKAFSQRHAIVFLPDLRFPVSPQLFEMLDAGALSLSGDVLAQLLQFLALAVASAGLLCWGRRFATPRSGVWAAAAWLGNPAVLAVGSAAMVDIGLALFCTMALYAWGVWREDGDSRWLTASAVFAGFAASTKYLGLFFVAALAAGALLAGSKRGSLRSAFRFAAIALLVLTPFYWRIVSQTGNPVFPFLSRIFGESDWSQGIDPLAAGGALRDPNGSFLGFPIGQKGNAGALLRASRRLAAIGTGFFPAATLSPFVLLLAPFLLGRALRDRQARFLVLIGIPYGICWYFGFPEERYLLPILPAWTAAATAGLDDFLRRLRQSRSRAVGELGAAALALILVTPATSWTARTLRWRGRLPVTPQQREAYLSRWLPVYPALQELNARFGSRYVVYVLFRENALYFADGRFFGDHFGPHRYSLVLGALENPPRLLEVLRGMGVTHLLVDRTEGGGSQLPVLSYASTFRPLPAPAGTALFELPETAASP